MQRVLRIVLIITFMLLLILWFSTIFKTCNKDKTANVDVTESGDLPLDTTDVFEDLGDEFFEDESFDDANNSTNSDPVADQDLGGGTSNDDPFGDSESYTDYTGELSNEPSTSTTVNSNAGENAGYLVVAGSFLLEENAVRMKNKLINMGYSAEVRNFNFSQYYSVIAGRFNDRGSANQLAATLKGKGIDCLVHKRQY